MLKGIIISALMVFGFSSMASPIYDAINKINLSSLEILQSNPEIMGLNWKVGEYANYDIAMLFGRGTMVMKVASETDKGFWLNQDVDLLGQKQLIEILIDKETGAILEVRSNGKPQDLPNQSPPEVIETREESVTVPAGTYECLYLETRDEAGKIGKLWMNPRDIPVAGMIKNIQPGQFGEVTLELTGFGGR